MKWTSYARIFWFLFVFRSCCENLRIWNITIYLMKLAWVGRIAHVQYAQYAHVAHRYIIIVLPSETWFLPCILKFTWRILFDHHLLKPSQKLMDRHLIKKSKKIILNVPKCVFIILKIKPIRNTVSPNRLKVISQM